MKRFLGFWLALCMVIINQAQQKEVDLESFAEKMFQVQDIDVNYEDLYESLLLLYTHPINLNKATLADLESLFALTPTQIQGILNHRLLFGDFLSLYELQTIPGLDLETIQLILPFVRVGDDKIDGRPIWERLTSEPNNYLLLRNTTTLQRARGFRDQKYAGDRNHIYGRFRVSHSKDFSLGFTFEKDAGEQIAFRERQNGFDFYSYHLQVQNQGIFKNIVLGDYQIQYGQGLVLGSGFGAGKGAESVLTIRRSSTGVKPYTSILESGFFRGAASTVSHGNLTFTAFYSSLDQDANLVSDSTYSDFDEFINAIQETGLHRTPSELSARNQVNEGSWGMVITHQPIRNLNMGLTHLQTKFSNPIQRRPNNYNQFEFTGQNNEVSSFFANFNWRNFAFFSEFARSKSGGMAGVGGFVAALSDQIDMGMVYRNYDRDFHSFYSNAFAESSRAINESGIYWGLKIRPVRRLEFSLYYDRFKFPWLRFRTEAPSSGDEFLIRATWKPTKKVLIYAQVRQERDQISTLRTGENLSMLSNDVKRNYLFNLDYDLGSRLSFKTKVQFSSYELNETTSNGYALIQDLNYVFGPIKIGTRIAVFDTDNFENRQYVYERDVLYAFSIPAYNGTGTRQYLIIQYNATKKLKLWMRYSSFIHHCSESLGSGLNEIEGNRRSEFRIQTKISF
ncbi:MAG: helix-hairpin-helix domain-containing protein [Cyclobacteriaceae bacterium]|nr:helix-hairpin-helix domain-containing protein [Cyclobacteriaceae bacterium HetDA_MAG_MS6]